MALARVPGPWLGPETCRPNPTSASGVPWQGTSLCPCRSLSSWGCRDQPCSPSSCQTALQLGPWVWELPGGPVTKKKPGVVHYMLMANEDFPTLANIKCLARNKLSWSWRFYTQSLWLSVWKITEVSGMFKFNITESKGFFQNFETTHKDKIAST